MDNRYLISIDPTECDMFDTPKGAVNLAKVFSVHGDLTKQSNAETCLRDVLARVRQRWLDVPASFPLTGIVWARHLPKDFPLTGYEGIKAIGLDLAGGDLKKTASEVVNMGGDSIANHPAISSYLERELDIHMNRPEMKGLDRGRVRKAIVADQILAYMGAKVMRMATTDMSAVGATVIGLTSKVDLRDGKLVSGLLCFHEHIATGPQRLWCGGAWDANQDCFTALDEEWETVSGMDYDNHPVMNLYTDRLPTELYTGGAKGGEA